MVEVSQSPDSQRFQSGEAYLTYTRTGDQMVIEHTIVPPAMGGSGVGSALVRRAVEYGRSEGLSVGATCWFAQGWLDRHLGV